MRIGIDEAKMAVEEGQLSACVICHRGGVNDGRGGCQWWHRLRELAAGDVEHIRRDIESREGRDAALRNLLRGAIVSSLGFTTNTICICSSGRSRGQCRPIVILQVQTRPHRQLEDLPLSPFREPLAQRCDTHEPFRPIELLIELLGVVARQRGRTMHPQGDEAAQMEAVAVPKM